MTRAETLAGSIVGRSAEVPSSAPKGRMGKEESHNQNQAQHAKRFGHVILRKELVLFAITKRLRRHHA